LVTKYDADNDKNDTPTPDHWQSNAEVFLLQYQLQQTV